MVKNVQLKNGMNVLLNSQKKSPVVNLQVWVYNGSAQEAQDVAGVSHFIEHLLFKGTKNYGPGEIAKEIEGSGGQLNAYTSFDQTVYYMTLGRSEIKTAFKALSDMIFSPLFDPQEINREREVVIEEIRRGLDEPHRVNHQFVFENFFEGHPYSRPIIGYESVIQNISREKIQTFFKNQYSPKNMFLVLTGDFDEDICRSLLDQYFDVEVEDSLAYTSVPSVRFAQRPFRTFFQNTKFEDTYINFYWPGANFTSKDFISLELIALILGQGESSRFYSQMKLKEVVVKTIGSYAYSLKEAGLFALVFKPLKGKENKSIDIFCEQWRLCCENPFTEEEFEKALVNFKSDFFYSLETCEGLAQQVGQNYFYSNDPNYSQKYLQMLDELKLSDLQEAFETYLLQVSPQCVVTSPQAEVVSSYGESQMASLFSKAETEKDLKNRNAVTSLKPSFSKSNRLAWRKVNSKSQDIQSIRLDSGIRLYIKPQNDTPVVHMDLAFLGGSKIDSSCGANNILAQRVWGRCSKSKEESEIIKEFDHKATYHTVFSGRHSLGMQLTTLSPFLTDMLNLNFELLKWTSIDEQILEREHKLLKQQFQQRKDHPSQVVFIQFMKSLFQNHYYGRDALEEVSKIKTMASEEISEFIKSHFNPHQGVVSIVGDVDPEKISQQIEKAFQGLISTETVVNSSPIKTEYTEEYKFIPSEKEQSHVVLGYRGLDYQDPRRSVLSVVQALLSGQGGRLFIELRDKASLAYTVTSVHMEALESGYLGCYIACAPSKKEVAIKMMREELYKLVENPVEDEELHRAKKSVIGNFEISLQKNSQISERILFDSLYGLEFDFYQTLKSRVGNVTSKDIQNLMSEIVRQPEILICLG